MGQRSEHHLGIRSCLSCDSIQSWLHRWRSQSPARCRHGSKVMPGFSFATPGPADGVGSLASRQCASTRRHPPDWLSLAVTCVCVLLGVLFCHHYYDQLRLPNAHRKFLCYSARPSLPVVSAFDAYDGSTRRSGKSFRRELWSRGGLPCSALS